MSSLAHAGWLKVETHLRIGKGSIKMMWSPKGFQKKIHKTLLNVNFLIPSFLKILKLIFWPKDAKISYHSWQNFLNRFYSKNLENIQKMQKYQTWKNFRLFPKKLFRIFKNQSPLAAILPESPRDLLHSLPWAKLWNPWEFFLLLSLFVLIIPDHYARVWLHFATFFVISWTETWKLLSA